MDTVEIIKAVVFGVVQGVTEWLPISSTGHMILLDEFLQLDMTLEFMEMFYVVIQLGAILAVLLLFWSKLCPVSFHGKPHLKKDVLALWPKIIVACIPAGVIGILWSDMLNALFFHPLVVITMLALFGVLFLVVEHQNKERTPTIESVEKGRTSGRAGNRDGQDNSIQGCTQLCDAPGRRREKEPRRNCRNTDGAS